jgi:hypothetical protein
MSIDELKQVLSYDKNTGEFTWTDKAPTKVKNKPAIAKDKLGYVCLKIKGKMYKAHRLAWAFVYGYLPEQHIDHINGNPSDNRIVNLREATRSLNLQNLRKPRSDNQVGLLGVCKNGNNWRAEIRVDGKKINLGTYPCPEQAHAAYINAKRKHHEGCTL